MSDITRATGIVARFAFVGALALCVESPAQSVLDNGVVRFTFNDAAGSLTQITSVSSGFTYPIQNDQPWKIQFRDSSSFALTTKGPIIMGAAPPLVSSQTLPNGTQELAFAWYAQFDPNNSVAVLVKYALALQDDYATVTIAVDADGVDRYGLGQIPQTNDVGIHETRLYLTPAKSVPGPHYGLISVRGVHGIREPVTSLTRFNSRVDHDNYTWSTTWSEDGLRDPFLWNKLVGAYWNDSGQGIYAFPERDRGYQALATAYQSLAPAVTQGGIPRFQMTHIEQHSNDVQAGINAASSQPVRIGVFSSTFGSEEGWYGFAQLYRTFLEHETLIFERGRIGDRSDLPSLLKEGGTVNAVYGVQKDPADADWDDPAYRQDFINLLHSSVQYLGATELSLIFFAGWNKYACTPQIPSCISFTQYEPQFGQELVFQGMQQTGVLRPWVYTLTSAIEAPNPAAMPLPRPGDPQYGSFAPFLARTLSGSPLSVTWVHPDETVFIFHYVLAETGQWGSFINPILQVLNLNDGVGGAYFDATYPGPVNYDPQVGTVGPGRHQIEGVADTLEAVRTGLKQLDNGFMTLCEESPEYAVPWHDMTGGDAAPVILPAIFKPSKFNLYIGGDSDFFTEVFTSAVFHEHSPLFMLLDFEAFLYGGSPEGFEYYTAYGVLVGGNIPIYSELAHLLLGACGDPNWWTYPNHATNMQCSNNPAGLPVLQAFMNNYASMTKQLVALRKNSKYLIDGQWWPRVEFVNPFVVNTTTIGFVDYQTVQLNAPDVVHSVWRAEDGDFGLFFANAFDGNKTVKFSFAPARYGLSAAAMHTLYETTPEGRHLIKSVVGPIQHEVTLAPHSVRHFEVVP